MGACCGKPDRKSQGYVLGGSNASAEPDGHQPGAVATGKAKTQSPSSQRGGGQTLGNSQAPATQRTPGELSASALAAQKRAEAAENRGVQQGGGKLSKKLAEDKKKSPFAVEEPTPELANAAQWN
ncbi:hypothetical protein BGX28_001069 [Mortierella sp. GBA30]|nr:hypothetical protein BGX28_001069 [Mortierella sp. GBA30]